MGPALCSYECPFGEKHFAQVQRTVQRLGYALHRLSPKRVLDAASKRKRLAWARKHSARRPVWWRNRAYADAHYWYLPRSRSEVAGSASTKAVYRKRAEGKGPQFHGGKGTGYQQGRRVGVWGVLTSERLSVVFLPEGRVSGASHAGVVRRYYARWASDRQGVFHDGERALHSPAAKEAYASAGAPCLKLPPYSPDMNPIENAWAVLNARMEATKPKGWEREKAFRRRVRNAVAWMNSTRTGAFHRIVSSMPKRVEMCIESNGALTPY